MDMSMYFVRIVYDDDGPQFLLYCVLTFLYIVIYNVSDCRHCNQFLTAYLCVSLYIFIVSNAFFFSFFFLRRYCFVDVVALDRATHYMSVCCRVHVQQHRCSCICHYEVNVNKYRSIMEQLNFFSSLI